VLFCAADARSLPLPAGRFAAVVSGLALNVVPDPARAVAEFARVAAPGGVVAAYVWDYAGGMAMMRHFWEAAVALDPAAATSAEASHFPLCRPDPLRVLWADAGLAEVTVPAIEVPTVFADFDDYWEPLLGGQGPAPRYVASLTAGHRRSLRASLRDRLPRGPGGSIPLSARARAVRGTTPAPAWPSRRSRRARSVARCRSPPDVGPVGCGRRQQVGFREGSSLRIAFDLTPHAVERVHESRIGFPEQQFAPRFQMPGRIVPVELR
jgi:hypothetical protein